MNLKVRIQLSTMMFLEYFIWGAWWVTMGTYLAKTLQFEATQIGLAYGATAIAAMVSPVFVGMIADRFFASEKVLGFLHIIGGGLLLMSSTLTTFAWFYPVIILYTICYMPTLALTNALSFHHLTDPGKEFPTIRVLGTLGWIVAGLMVGFWQIEAQPTPLRLAAIASFALGVFSFFLPHTPPKKKQSKPTLRDVLGLDALKLFKNFSFAILVICSMLVCIPLSFYYSFTNLFLNDIGMINAAAKMTLGQVSEMVFLLVMPFFFKRLGVKNMILIAMLAWMGRYLFFAFGNNESLVWMLYMGILLHGISYDFFFVTGQIYVDKKADRTIRAAAQGLITFATYGVGMFIGTYLSGEIVNFFTDYTNQPELIYNWEQIWIVPAVASLVVFVIFAIFFHDKVEKKEKVAVV
ncbi:MAG: nucleoside permease [Candidatus Cyclobacteriaceae bacterium M3_2C_046]